MDQNAGSPPARTLAALAMLLLVAAGAAWAQLQRPGAPPGGGGEAVAFEIQSVDPQSWVVTARDLESGESFSFRLPPEAFRGQRFKADLSGARAGSRISVEGPPRAQLDEAVIRTPLRAGGRFDRSVEGPPGFDRQRPPQPPTPRRPSGPLSSAGRSPLLERGGAGAAEYEVVSVDPRTWQVEARGPDGSRVTLEVDPEAFIGYRFEAAVQNLRSGQGFELLAPNERPLADCCVVKSVPRR